MYLSPEDLLYPETSGEPELNLQNSGLDRVFAENNELCAYAYDDRIFAPVAREMSLAMRYWSFRSAGQKEYAAIEFFNEIFEREIFRKSDIRGVWWCLIAKNNHASIHLERNRHRAALPKQIKSPCFID